MLPGSIGRFYKIFQLLFRNSYSTSYSLHIPGIYCFIQVFSKHTKKCLPWLLKGPIRRYHNPTCFFVFQRKMLFPEQLCHFQYDGGLQNTRLTENGRPPEPNLCMVSLISKIKAYIHPNLFLTASKSLKARLVVFSSRHAILQFWSFCSL